MKRIYFKLYVAQFVHRLNCNLDAIKTKFCFLQTNPALGFSGLMMNPTDEDTRPKKGQRKKKQGKINLDLLENEVMT
jgi:hypothetical protein